MTRHMEKLVLVCYGVLAAVALFLEPGEDIVTYDFGLWWSGICHTGIAYVVLTLR